MTIRSRQGERLRRRSRKAARRCAALWRERAEVRGTGAATAPTPPSPKRAPKRGAHIRRTAAGRVVEVTGVLADVTPAHLDQLMEMAEAACPICNGSHPPPDDLAVISRIVEWDAARERFVIAPPGGSGHVG